MDMNRIYKVLHLRKTEKSLFLEPLCRPRRHLCFVMMKHRTLCIENSTQVIRHILWRITYLLTGSIRAGLSIFVDDTSPETRRYDKVPPS